MLHVSPRLQVARQDQILSNLVNRTPAKIESTNKFPISLQWILLNLLIWMILLLYFQTCGVPPSLDYGSYDCGDQVFEMFEDTETCVIQCERNWAKYYFMDFLRFESITTCKFFFIIFSVFHTFTRKSLHSPRIMKTSNYRRLGFNQLNFVEMVNEHNLTFLASRPI